MASDIKIKDLHELIDAWLPVAIYIDGDCVWDDDVDEPYELHLQKYISALEGRSTVESVRFDIVHCHHSIVYIRTTEGGATS